MNKSISIQLTDEQRLILKPLFVQVENFNKSNPKELGCSIFAQIYKDGIIAIFADNDLSLRIQDAFGTIPSELRGVKADSLAERNFSEIIIGSVSHAN